MRYTITISPSANYAVTDNGTVITIESGEPVTIEVDPPDYESDTAKFTGL